jgi:hypothetical protein
MTPAERDVLERQELNLVTDKAERAAAAGFIGGVPAGDRDYWRGQARLAAEEAYQLGRRHHGLELAALLTALIDSGSIRVPFTDEILDVLGPLIPPDRQREVVIAASDLQRLAEISPVVFTAELDRRLAEFIRRTGDGTPQGIAELAEFVRKALADPLPLADDDSEAQADAAERLAQFTVPLDLPGDPE